MNKLRVFIICQEEPFYIPKVIRYLLENQGVDYEVVGYTKLPPHRKNKSMKDWFCERFEIYTWWELIVAGTLFGYCKIVYRILSYITGFNPYAVDSIFKSYFIDEIYSLDINDNSYINLIRNLDVDVILSISSPQLFGEELLNTPVKYCLNGHGTLLPRHRGVFGSWWTLYCGDHEAGATIHTMELKLDAGDIAWQSSFDVAKDDTQYSIAYKTKKLMSQGFVEVLAKIANNTFSSLPQKYEHSYHRVPTKEQGKKFHKNNLRIIKITDILNTLSRKFS